MPSPTTAGLILVYAMTCFLSLPVEAMTAPDLAEPSSNPASADVEQLQSEATAAINDQEWPEAEAKLLEAQHRLHREFGVITTRQIPIVDQLASVFIAQEQYRRANQLKEFNHFVRRQTSDAANPIQPELALATWYLQSGQWRAGRGLVKSIRQAETSDLTFDPDWALLILNLELYNPVCCDADLALSLYDQAKANPISAPDLTALEQAVRRVLVLEGRFEAAQALTSSALPGLTRAAQLIPGKRLLKGAEQDRMMRLKLENELRLRRYNSGLNRDEDLYPTQLSEFSVALDSNFLPVEGPNGMEFRDRIKQFETMIGSPFRFNLEQLRRRLPARFYHLDRLHALEIQVSFDLTHEGRVRNITFLDRYPREIRTLMRETLKAARFVPALDQGIFSAQEGFTLTQHFGEADSFVGQPSTAPRQPRQSADDHLAEGAPVI